MDSIPRSWPWITFYRHFTKCHNKPVTLISFHIHMLPTCNTFRGLLPICDEWSLQRCREDLYSMEPINSRIHEVEVRIYFFCKKKNVDHNFLAYIYSKKTFMVPIILGLSWSLYESTRSYLERCCWSCYLGWQYLGNDPNGLPLTLQDTSITHYVYMYRYEWYVYIYV